MAEQKNEEKKEEKRLSVLEETKAAIEELKKEREEMTKVKEELEKLRSDQLLAGTAGGHVDPEPVKEDTPKEYSDKVMKGEIKAK